MKVIEMGTYLILDTPGVGDVREGKKITNKEIQSMILKNIQRHQWEISAIVFMITIDINANRADADVYELVRMFRERFYNFSANTIYGIKDVKGKIDMIDLKEYYEANSNLKEMGITMNNVIVCPKKNFSDLITACQKKNRKSTTSTFKTKTE